VTPEPPQPGRPSPEAYQFGPFRLDARQRRLLRNEVDVTLTGKEFEVLLLLVQSAGQTVTKQTFMDQVWRDTVVDEANLTCNISTLRSLLEDDAREPRYIRTIPRQGYRFVAPVEEADSQRPVVVFRERTRAHLVIEEENESPRPHTGRWLAAGGVAIAAGIASLFVIGPRFPSAPAERVAAPAAMAIPAKTPPPSVAPLTTFPDLEFSPALSPDGRFVAYCRTATREAINIFVAQVGVGEPVRVTSGNGRQDSPAWSPDGRYLAFNRTDPDPQNDGIYVVPAFGGAERRVLAVQAVAMVAWSPDGNTIAFTRRPSAGHPYAVWLLDLQSHETHQITNPPSDTLGDFFCAFSPDGRQLAFARLTGDSSGDLWITSTTGETPRRVTFDERDISGVAWDVPRQALVYATNRDDRWGLWTVAAGGGTPRALDPPVLESRQPTISHDGRVLVCTVSTIRANIFRLDLTAPSHQPVPLVASTRQDRYPRVSEDSRSMAFMSDRTGHSEVWMSQTDGSAVRQITSAGRSGAAQPALSPDGQSLAYVARDDATSDLYVAAIDGGRPLRLTSGSNCAAPSWSRDGRSLYVSMNRGDDWQVWRIPAAGGKGEQITQHGGYESSESVDGRFLYYNKYGLARVGLYRAALDGGDEQTVLPLPQLDSLGDWQVARDGIYFIHRYDTPRTLAKTPSLRFLEFASGQVRTISALPDPGSHPGLNIVEGGRAAIYSSVSNRGADLVVVTNFR
jgi:Tol biopolymer transport system component/DNA-binding winged helix-turn-helix (wHTH) protein